MSAFVHLAVEESHAYATSVPDDVRQTHHVKDITPCTTDKQGSGESMKSIVAPFSVFTTRQKWAIITLAGFAGLFSPLTANIYFPAIKPIANAFGTSVELINVTVTVYMVLQGVSPMLLGTLSDRLGRRPLFLVCLTLLSVSCIGLAVVPTDAYWLLVVLRCFQAGGSASTIALGSGTISDIAEPSERGGFLGIFNLWPLVGPCVGPIIGGVLTGSLGWRSIFWFLAIFSGLYLVFFFLLYPETLRAMVGNGSIPAPSWNRPLLPYLSKYGPLDVAVRPPPKKFFNPLRQFAHPSVCLVLVFNGAIYSVYYGITTTMSSLFSDAYPFLTEGEVGVCFLAIGVGCAMGSFVNGKLLDADFKRIQRKFDKISENGNGTSVVEGREVGTLAAGFPIEYARLRGMPVYVVVFVGCIIGYGWSVQGRVHIACPLILQFVVGWMLTCIMNTSQTILMDLFPTQGSSITAANNLVRCTMGAILVSIIDFILVELRPGWTFSVLAGVCVAVLPINWVVIRFGPRWRERRM